MPWAVEFHPEFDAEFADLPEDVQDELLSRLHLLAEFGPNLGRPHVDTLGNSSFPNMKELRFREDDGLWRFAFAFDPQRKAIVLVGGNKVGANQKSFYADLIRTADHRFSVHLKSLKRLKKE
jgi:hypothetical protein